LANQVYEVTGQKRIYRLRSVYAVIEVPSFNDVAILPF